MGPFLKLFTELYQGLFRLRRTTQIWYLYYSESLLLQTSIIPIYG